MVTDFSEFQWRRFRAEIVIQSDPYIVVYLSVVLSFKWKCWTLLILFTSLPKQSSDKMPKIFGIAHHDIFSNHSVWKYKFSKCYRWEFAYAKLELWSLHNPDFLGIMPVFVENFNIPSIYISLIQNYFFLFWKSRIVENIWHGILTSTYNLWVPPKMFHDLLDWWKQPTGHYKGLKHMIFPLLPQLNYILTQIFHSFTIRVINCIGLITFNIYHTCSKFTPLLDTYSSSISISNSSSYISFFSP